MKMKKILVGLLTIAMASAYSSTVSAAKGGGSKEIHDSLQGQIDNIETTIETIELTPGPTGADGEDGAPGVAGADGEDGAPGVAGVDGEDGSPGVAGADGEDGAPGAGVEVSGVINGELLSWVETSWVATAPADAVMGRSASAIPCSRQHRNCYMKNSPSDILIPAASSQPTSDSIIGTNCCASWDSA